MQALGQRAAERVARSIGDRLKRDGARHYDPNRDRPIIDAAVAELRARGYSVALVDWRAAFVANGWWSTDADPIVDAFLVIGARSTDDSPFTRSEVDAWLAD